ncbi:hypothetical protein [Micromonospora sp. NPDC005173]|uniref:hypothetical protein n=1 Tax=Micromonospora sp. NPDC005173 TaxID=3157165 RepID=UPI0033AEB06A
MSQEPDEESPQIDEEAREAQRRLAVFDDRSDRSDGSDDALTDEDAREPDEAPTDEDAE